MRLYYTAGPNEALIISGGPTRTVTEPDGTKRQVGYRVKLGGGAFVIPWLESVSVLPLDVFTVRLKVERVFAANNVLITAEGQGQVKVKGDEASIRLASEHFLGKGGEAIQSVAEEVIGGHMRAAVGTRTVEEIIRSQEQMAAEVTENAGRELGRMGLSILSFSFKEITDEQGFIAALAEPRIAQVKRDAVIARAEAEKDALVRTSLLKQEGDLTKLRTEEEVLEATAKFEIKRAGQQAEVNQHRARADVAYDLQRTEIARQLKEQEAEVQLLEKRKAIEVQEQEIVRREKELEASVKRPAEAHSYQARLEAEIEAYRKELEGKGRAAWIRVEGEAEAQSIRARGEAEASAMAARAESYRRYNQAAMVEMFVKVLPELARAVSEPLSKVEKIVMVGGNGESGVSKLTSQIAQAVAQVPVVVETITGVNLNRLLEGFVERGAGAASKAIDLPADAQPPAK
jgi:flotillin